MIDGTAANSSTAVPTGRRSQSGASSVRNTAMPNEIGTEMTSAMTEVISVP